MIKDKHTILQQKLNENDVFIANIVSTQSQGCLDDSVKFLELFYNNLHGLSNHIPETNKKFNSKEKINKDDSDNNDDDDNDDDDDASMNTF